MTAENGALAVIPARYASSRFPGKALALLLGRPMIAHVVARALEAGCFDEVLVATDDERIAAAAAQAGARPVLTGPAASGTDRVAAVVRGERAGIVVNLQGDEPAMPPGNLQLLVGFLRSRPDVSIATLALPGAAADLADPEVVKVVCDLEGRALYFSRAGIPFQRHAAGGVVRRHLGLYGYRREALLRFASLPECTLERVEALEQLRALTHGMTIHVLDVQHASVAVDVPGDVARAEEALRRMYGNR